jgi:hypothetical protein
MGNYHNLEYEFVERTLHLIAQYESLYHKYPYKEQYNYTLLINCLTGLIVMPKERTINSIPNDRLLSSLKKEMGLQHTIINNDISNLRDFIVALRHCVAHFSIEVKSQSADYLVDEIIFYDNQKGLEYIVATFQSSELLPFVRYYGNWLLSNMKKNPNR